MDNEIKNKEMKVVIAGNYYGNLAINSIFERLVTGFSDYEEKNEITGDFTGTRFKSAYADVYINARMLYSLLVYSYMVEKIIDMDDETYQENLFSVTNSQIENRKISLENLSAVKWNDKKETKLWERIINLFPESMAMYGTIVKKTSEIERNEIISQIVEKYNTSHQREVDRLIRESDKNLEDKVKELFEKMDDIFINSINASLGYELSSLDIKSYLLLMLKDAFTLIALQLIFENSSVTATKNLTFYGDKWYVYFLMVLLNEYRNTGNNLLRLKSNPAFLNFGATVNEIFGIIRKFFSNKRMRKEESNPLEKYPELPHRLYYFLLGYGASRRESYVEPQVRTSEKALFEFKIDDVVNPNEPERSFSAQLATTNFRIRRIAQMLVLSGYSSTAATDFSSMFADARRDVEDGEEVGIDIEESFMQLIKAAGPEIADDWDALKSAYSEAPKAEKRKILNELVAEVLLRTDSVRKKVGDKSENYVQLLGPFLENSNTAIQKNTILSLGNRIFIEHNFFSPERKKALEDLENFRKSGLKKYPEIKEKFPGLVNPLEALKLKMNIVELAEKRLLERARKRIVINTGIDYESGDYPIERYSVYNRIFYMIATYEKIFTNNELGTGDFIKAFESEYYYRIFHSLVSDLATMISAKEEGKFVAENVVIEYDYLPEILEKTEKYFNFFLLDEEELEKISIEEKREAEMMLLLFNTALKTAFEFYINPKDFMKMKTVPRSRHENDDETDYFTDSDIFSEVMDYIDPETFF